MEAENAVTGFIPKEAIEMIRPCSKNGWPATPMNDMSLMAGQI